MAAKALSRRPSPACRSPDPIERNLPKRRWVTGFYVLQTLKFHARPPLRGFPFGVVLREMLEFALDPLLILGTLKLTGGRLAFAAGAFTRAVALP
jgi:hypothetical protein